jgi:hypothetical protein
MHLFVSLLVAFIVAGAQASPPNAALRIVVIEGEDAVNVIQQKTAVAPVIEIRDRNNLPVSGVAVTFSVGGQGASFGGLSTLTVTTNAAGQAAAVGLTPTAAGAIQIHATALVQGQALTATIAQTNVLTAAQAAAAASGASGAGASGAAGGGGGLSATTVGVVGAAVAGGAIAATQAGGNEEPQTQRPTGARNFSGSFASTITLTFQGCTRVEAWAGTLQINVTSREPLAGDARIVNGATRVETVNCSSGPQAGAIGTVGLLPTPLSGTAANFGFTSEVPNTFQDTPTSVPGTNVTGFKFTGTLNGEEITGTLSHSRRIEGGGSSIPGTGSATVSITLR